MLVQMAPASNLPDSQVASANEALAEYRKLKRLISPTKKQRQRRKLLEAIFDQSFTALEAKIEEFLEQAGAEPITQALTSGLASLQPLTATGDMDQIVSEFVDEVHRIAHDQTTYPLFDEISSKLLNASVKEGKLLLSELSVTRGKSAPLASTLFDRLPLFESANVGEILDIRRELERPLVRFRGAILKFGDTIKTAPWDRDFPAEVEHLISRDVLPVVTEIEQAVADRPYLATMARKLGDRPLSLPAGSLLGLAVSQATSLPSLAAQALGVGVAAAFSTFAAHMEWLDARREAEDNQLFFYYRLRKRLS